MKKSLQLLIRIMTAITGKMKHKTIMTKQHKLLTTILTIAGFFLILTMSCEKEDSIELPTLTTLSVSEITETTAKSGGNITDDGGAEINSRGLVWSASSNPTLEDHTGMSTEGSGSGVFNNTMTGLSPSTDYYVKAWATNSKGTSYGSVMSFFTLRGCSTGSFTDTRDGTVYQTVTIGTQVWMAENLRYLPSVVGRGTGSTTTPYYYVYDYNGTNVTTAKATSNYTTYGVLYNWPAAMNGAASSTGNPSGVQGVCPTGWHLPSDAEWTQLTDYLGGASDAGGKLKETGTTHWSSPNIGATNEACFTALPGGYRTGGSFGNIGKNGLWWSSTEHNMNYAWSRYMYYGSSSVSSYNFSKCTGFSVRCVRNM